MTARSCLLIALMVAFNCFVIVEQPGKSKAPFTNLVAFLSDFIHVVISDVAKLKEKVAHQGAFTTVYVSNDYKVEGFLFLFFVVRNRCFGISDCWVFLI